MNRVARRSRRDQPLQLDSLMDILTCTVGIMVVVAMFSAIESSDIQFRLFRPMLQEPHKDMSYRNVLVSNKGIRILDADPVISDFMATVTDRQLTSEKMRRLVDEFNQKTHNDDWFEYSVQVGELADLFLGWLLVREKEKDVILEKNEMEDEESRFLKRLEGMDSKAIWVRFLVAPDSIELFRAARTIASEKGFVTGWDTMDFDFPLVVQFMGPRVGGSGPLITEPQSIPR